MPGETGAEYTSAHECRRPKLPPSARAASTDDVARNCGHCGRSLDIRDPEKIVCVARLEYRDPAAGGDCSYYLPARPGPAPAPPQLDRQPAAPAAGEHQDPPDAP